MKNNRSKMNQKTERELYFYPPDTVGSNSDGYFHRLNSDQKEALLELQKWSRDNNVDIVSLSIHTLHPTLTLLRYLRANNFDSAKAVAHMLANIKWREQKNVKKLLDMSPEDILGCPMKLVTEGIYICIFMYIYIYICVCLYIYTYIYI
jgi:hypothetical protein